MAKPEDSLQLLERKARESQEVLGLLHSIAQDMSFRRSPSFLLDKAVGQVAKVMRVEAASLFLLNEETGVLDFAVIKGLNAQALRELDLHLKPAEGLAGWVFANDKPAVINDPDKDPRFKPGIDWLTGFKTHNLLAAPIRVNGRPFGVMEVVNRRKQEPFTDEDGELLSAIAHLLSTTLDNVRTLQALEASQTQLKTLVENMPGGYVGVDLQGRITHANPRALDILEWTEIPLGKTLAEALSKGAAELGQVIAQVLAEGHPIIRQTATLHMPRRGERRVGYSSFPLHASGRNFHGAGLMFQDITGENK
jgi:PAS domain S-box-containing protein